MKKISIILVMLFWCNVSFAGCIQGNCTNGQGTYTFASGSKYVGEFKDGKRHGQGILTSTKGYKYVGEFKDGKRHGQGILTSTKGYKYVGEFKDGKYNGQGTFTWADGAKYVGEYKDDKRHGQGTMTFANGDKSVGEWKNGKSQTTTKVTKPYTPTTNSYEEAFNIKTTWWDRTVWFFEDLFESDESEKDKEIAELKKRIKRLESNRGTTNEIKELKKCVQDLSMGLPCYVH